MSLLGAQIEAVAATMPFRVVGQVLGISGLTIEAGELALPIGALCRIHSFGGKTSKAEVIKWLKRSLDAVKEAHLAAKPEDMKRKVTVAKHDATVDGMYLRILVHNNEHMGQLIAYARMTGVKPPWSDK